MKALIVEDDFTSRRLLQALLSPFGDCDIAVNGKEALIAFDEALAGNSPYQLICLDIMMPEMNGQDVLKEIRKKEAQIGIFGLDCTKVVITTALGDRENVIRAFREQCDGYLVKPFDKSKVVEQLKALEFIKN